ncbi:rhamnulokinase [Bacteroidales bacterium OttesenSCG-928-B11]|nr:rhamnulokinase [Bacteroidales bacterium OttesenSCG-928-B11]MDL2326696.1 rhamnulokinase [Bacteroidales bacterium OttesenSCG-928-A14]
MAGEINKNYLSIDLGAGSGRAIVGCFKDGKIFLEELHRFENRPVKLNGTLYWDFPALFDNVKKGIVSAQRKGYDLRGIGVDTWGVDFGLIDRRGNLVANPVTYRDSRTQGMCDEVCEIVPREEMYRISGIQQMEINTIYQLLSLRKNSDPSLEIADRLLFTPDLVNYFLTGRVANEYTIASTSQLLNAQTKKWENTLFQKLNLPLELMGEIIQPGEVVGSLIDEITEETGAKNAKVFVVGSHDTASAIGAIPEEGGSWAFLSSGTWSLLGVLSENPILSKKALENDFTNEGGVDDKILFMRNITGLWLLQRLMEEWGKDEKLSYEMLLDEAEKTEPFRSIVDSDDPSFSNPLNMRVAIQEYCRKTGQLVPQTRGELTRCVLESLAMKYAVVMRKLADCANRKIDKLHVVGGGGQNRMLNQFIADVLDMEVVTALTEATAIGNIMQQAIADHTVPDWKAGHEIIRNSFDFNTFKPKNHEKWKNALREKKELFY